MLLKNLVKNAYHVFGDMKKESRNKLKEIEDCYKELPWWTDGFADLIANNEGEFEAQINENILYNPFIPYI